MPEQLMRIFTEISLFHLNILFLLGLALFLGTIGGRLFQKLRIPQVVGYIAIGIILGESGLKIVDHNLISTLQPLNYFALGLIGFMIGGELKKEVLLKYGKQFINILLFEGISAFLFVCLLVGIGGGLLFGDWRLSWALGLLLGAIASATAPAATTDVLWEYRTRGPLTITVLGIVAMDDALALFLFAIASSIAGSLSGNMQEGILWTFVHPWYELGGSIVIGVISGMILSKLIRKYADEEKLLTFSVGTVLLVLGLAIAMNVDMLLAPMTLGVVIVNSLPRKSKEVFRLVQRFTPPIYVLFFVLVGAKLNINHMTSSIVLIAAIYLLGRSFGKAIGANFGARISGAPKSVQKYLPLCLFSQAGVAIGLSILASHYFPGDIGNIIVIVITTTTFIVQIIGPPLVKLAVTKAREVGLNITEEDLIAKSTARDFMDKVPPLIYKNTPLSEILNIFSESNNLYYPVVNNERKLLGIISVDSIRNIFTESSLSSFILADDLMEPVVAKVGPEATIAQTRELLNRYGLEYLPVVEEDDTVVGFIERRHLERSISTRLMEMQKQADSLDGNLRIEN